MANSKIIIQSVSIRGNEADAVASLKFIILSVTRMATTKNINQSKISEVKKQTWSESEIYYSKRY